MPTPDEPDATSGCFDGAHMSARPPPPWAHVVAARVPRAAPGQRWVWMVFPAT